MITDEQFLTLAKSRMEREDLSISQLARQIGVTPSYLSMTFNRQCNPPLALVEWMRFTRFTAYRPLEAGERESDA